MLRRELYVEVIEIKVCLILLLKLQHDAARLEKNPGISWATHQ